MASSPDQTAIPARKRGIIWLQGIWLPLHGYNFSDTPLWAGIFLPIDLRAASGMRVLGAAGGSHF
jgi:hypothetical protein